MGPARKIPIKSITDFLTTPSRVAQTLDWRKSSGNVLNLRITKTHIELAVASHPSFQENLQPLQSIPLKTHTNQVENKKELDNDVAEALADVIRAHHVCGMVVGWPVQKEGRCGSSCGIVLHTLDQLTRSLSKNNVFHESRPICLYDSRHFLPTEDEWGRSPIYSRPAPSDKILHKASIEQYGEAEDSNRSEGEAILEIWNDFCQAHWPELDREDGAYESPTLAPVGKKSEWNDDLYQIDRENDGDAEIYSEAAFF